MKRSGFILALLLSVALWFLAAVLFSASCAHGETLTWTVDPRFSYCETVIYSATPSFTTKDKQDALVRMLRQFNLTNMPPAWTVNITNLCTITSSNFPPLANWTRLVVVPPGITRYHLTNKEPIRFYTATLRDYPDRQSLFATK